MPSQRTIAAGGLASGPSAREREQEQQRRDVAEQHVLDHVGGEEVVLAETVDWRDERGEEGDHPGAEGERLKGSGAGRRTAPRGGLPAHPEKAPDVDPGEQRKRSEHGGIREPLDMWMTRRAFTGHAQDCRNGVARRCTQAERLGG